MDKIEFTPLPINLYKQNGSLGKAFVLFFFALVVISVIGVGGWYLNYFYNTSNIDQVKISKPKANSQISTSPTSTNTEIPAFEVPADWSNQRAPNCGLTFRIPPAEEPYMIPRDPNTPPSSLDDEGKYWIFEEYPSRLFLFENLIRAIFKNPELPGSGYVSSSVEVMCSMNIGDYTTDSLFVAIQNDLLKNFSVVKMKTSGNANLWDREVKTATFEGGTFGMEQYYIFATPSHIYMIRQIGETTNADISAVATQIFQSIEFE